MLRQGIISLCCSESRGRVYHRECNIRRRASGWCYEKSWRAKSPTRKRPTRELEEFLSTRETVSILEFRCSMPLLPAESSMCRDMRCRFAASDGSLWQSATMEG